MLTFKEFYFDEILEGKGIKLPFVSIWEPLGVHIVMGASGTIEADVRNIDVNNIEIFKRKGGGCAVVLDKGMIIVSILTLVEEPFNNMNYFKKINKGIIWALRRSGVRNIEHKGVSDLVIDNKKILGCSLYRRKHLLYYQGVLLVNADLAVINKYLKYPKREPGYRSGRDHMDFITSLENEKYKIDCSKLCEDMQTYYNSAEFLI